MGFVWGGGMTFCVGFAGRGFWAAGQIFAREIVFVPATGRGFRTAGQIFAREIVFMIAVLA